MDIPKEKIEKIAGQARSFGRSKGLKPEDIDDFVQEVLLNAVVLPRGASFDHLLVDFLRKQYGNRTHPSGLARSKAILMTQRRKDVDIFCGEFIMIVEHDIPAIEPEAEVDLSSKTILDAPVYLLLNTQERAALDLFLKGLRYAEVSKLLGVCLHRVYQLAASIERKNDDKSARPPSLALRRRNARKWTLRDISLLRLLLKAKLQSPDDLAVIFDKPVAFVRSAIARESVT